MAAQRDEYGLTPQQRIFADAYLLSDNKRASAIKAGVSAKSAGTLAGRMCTNVYIQTYLARRRTDMSQQLESQYSINIDRILRELAAVALLDPAKMYDENGYILPINKMDEMTRRAVAAVEVTELTDSDGTLVGYAKKVKLVSKIAAIELLGRHLCMWNKKDTGGSSILNINIITDKNQLDHPDYPAMIEHRS